MYFELTGSACGSRCVGVSPRDLCERLWVCVLAACTLWHYWPLALGSPKTCLLALSCMAACHRVLSGQEVDGCAYRLLQQGGLLVCVRRRECKDMACCRAACLCPPSTCMLCTRSCACVSLCAVPCCHHHDRGNWPGAAFVGWVCFCVLMFVCLSVLCLIHCLSGCSQHSSAVCDHWVHWGSHWCCVCVPVCVCGVLVAAFDPPTHTHVCLHGTHMS